MYRINPDKILDPYIGPLKWYLLLVFPDYKFLFVCQQLAKTPKNKRKLEDCNSSFFAFCGWNWYVWISFVILCDDITACLELQM